MLSGTLNVSQTVRQTTLASTPSVKARSTVRSPRFPNTKSFARPLRVYLAELRPHQAPEFRLPHVARVPPGHGRDSQGRSGAMSLHPCGGS